MILFTASLPNELKIIKEEIKNLNLKWIKINFLLTWVWALNTIYSIKDYISKNNKPAFIVNLWICWKIDNNFNDFFQVYRITNLSNNKEAICPIYVKNSELKSIACSDSVITDKNELFKEEFVDMESFWIDFICSKEKIPYIIIKKPFDIVWIKSKNVNLKELENTLKWFNYIELINKIQNFLNKSKKIDVTDKINILKEKNKLTFSETFMLEKYINKMIAFWSNLDEIYKNLKNKTPKEILEIIKK
jgi:hypothetical protein